MMIRIGIENTWIAIKVVIWLRNSSLVLPWFMGIRSGKHIAENAAQKRNIVNGTNWFRYLCFITYQLQCRYISKHYNITNVMLRIEKVGKNSFFSNYCLILICLFQIISIGIYTEDAVFVDVIFQVVGNISKTIFARQHTYDKNESRGNTTRHLIWDCKA